jgi:hypothetical protein
LNFTQHKKAPGRIKRGDYQKIIKFAIDNGDESIGILGGEPSVHPQFVSLLEDAWRKGLRTSIFTNGLWSQEVIDKFKVSIKKYNIDVSIIINVNEPEITQIDEQSMQLRTLAELSKYCGLSFNIYHEHFNPLFLVDLIERSNCRRHIRLGIAVPIANQASQYIPIERYPAISNTIMMLAKCCDKKDITIGFDCGFTLCMFNESELGQLFLYGVKFHSTCGYPIDIGTDLSVWSCFPLSTFAQGYRLTDYNNKVDLYDLFKKQFGRLQQAGAMDKCVSCKYRRRKQCTSGCAAHVYRKLQSWRSGNE